MTGSLAILERPIVTTRRPWARAIIWLAALVPFFLVSYSFSNWLTSQRASVGTIEFDWENHIPFLAWTILPYWSIDIFYGLSLFVCASRTELDSHGKRLLSAQIIAVACFIAIPLQFGSLPPRTDGLPGILFEALAGFDRPFNQVPSLHIALLIILWALYRDHTPPRFVAVLNSWFALVGVSVLTTYQHHFIDVPTGVALGWLCIWLWPTIGSSPITGLKLTGDLDRLRISCLYALAGAAFAAAALTWGGILYWLLWPALSLVLVAAAYATYGVDGFQKALDGGMSTATRWLLAPYLAGVWLNSRAWTWRTPMPALVSDGVWLGRIPSAQDLRRTCFAAVVDLSAELQAPQTPVGWYSFPSLDLVTPLSATLHQAALVIEAQSRFGQVLVACALGYRRSAAAIATWLLATGRAQDIAGAVAIVRQARPRIVLTERDRSAIETAAASNPRAQQ